MEEVNALAVEIPEEEEITEELGEPTLSENAQCDSCFSAKAMWKLVGEGGSSLYLCGHHRNAHEPRISDWAKEIYKLDS